MLLANDIPLFEGILGDIFTEKFKEAAHEELQNLIVSAADKLHLELSDNFVAKVL